VKDLFTGNFILVSKFRSPGGRSGRPYCRFGRGNGHRTRLDSGSDL